MNNQEHRTIMYFSCGRIVWSILLAAAATPLNAADGVIRIDQSRAVAGNVTPGDAPGFPVTISEPGSYRLTGNLTTPDADATAIQITVDSVTLDLNGFSIIGPVGCTGPATTCLAAGQGVGVQGANDQALGPRGVRILNGSIRGMSRGAILMQGDGSVVERVNADRNPGGGIVAATVIASAATQNGSFGILATAVRDSTALQNLGDGIIVGTGGVATGNVSSFNGGFGMAVQFGTATGNTVFLNKSSGISASCPSTVIGNTIIAMETKSIETKGEGCVLANNASRP